MLDSSTWTITNAKAYDNVDGRQKQIYELSYTITGTKNGITDSMSDTIKVNYNPEGEWVAYEDLNEEILRGWAQTIMNKEAEERILEARIDAKAASVVSGLPWQSA